MPQVTLETLAVWKAAGINFKLVRCKGGYIVQVR